MTHYLRYKNDGILISSKTLNIDNPKLDCRLEGYENLSPKRIILDRNLEINMKSYIIRSIKKDNTIIFHNSIDKEKIKIFKKKGIYLIKLALNNKKEFNLRSVFKKLYSLGIRNLLVEGGNKITKNLLQNKLADKFYLFKSLKKLPINKKIIYFTSNNLLNKNYRLMSKINSRIAKDNITIYKR